MPGPFGSGEPAYSRDFLTEFQRDSALWDAQQAKKRADDLERDRNNLRRLLDAERAAHAKTKAELERRRRP
jgi:hypothetical protein